MTVIAAFELEHFHAAGGAACEPQSRHQSFSSRIDEADALDPRNGGADQLGKLETIGIGSSKAPAAIDRPHCCFAYAWIGVPEYQRSEGHAEVEIANAIDILEIRAITPAHELGRPAHRFESAHRRVHATRGDFQRTCEKLI